MKKPLSLFLCLCLAFLFLPNAFAADEELLTGNVKLLSYNVQGLFNQNYKEDYPAIAQIINGFDIAAVQEDFNFHPFLSRGVTLPYHTKHSGMTPVGDGLNFFSKYPLYNETRVTWNNSSGILDGGNDELTAKGFLYATIEIADSVFIDFYNLHADGYEDEFSIAAKRDNIRQLAEYVKAHSADRAVIIMGDTNMRLCRATDELNKLLLAPCGLTDAWAKVKHGGTLPSFGEFDNDPNGWWSICDSIDRVMYRSGGGVELEALTHEYVNCANSEGRSYSDHTSVQVTMRYIVTEPGKSCLPAKDDTLPDFLRRFIAMFTAIHKLLSDLPRFIRTGGMDELIADIKHVVR